MFKGKVVLCQFCNTPFKAIHHTYNHCSTECRFWDKVEKLGPNECWEWKAYKTQRGYGQFKYKEGTRAHRIAWILTHGPIPKGLLLLHHCDNPPCCNPSHLFLGTQKDNIADMFNKNRQHPRYGENAGSVKLTEEQVKIIKDELAKGTLQRILAEKYGVARETIGLINTGKNWSHV